MDKLYNVQQPEKHFGQKTKFYVLDINEAAKPLDKGKIKRLKTTP